MAGKVVDGYIVGGTATLDINDDRTFSGKAGINGGLPIIAITDASGNYNFDASFGQHLVKVTGGVDIATNTPFVGQLLASPGSGVATPLTTLVINQVLNSLPAPVAGVSSPFSSTAFSSAETALKTNLGIPAGVSLMTTDPVAAATAIGSSNAQLLQLGTSIQVLMNKVTAAVVSAAGSASPNYDAIQAQAAKALAQTLSSPVDLTKSDSASTLISSVVTQTVNYTNSAGLTTGLAPASVVAVASVSIASQVSSVATASATTLISTSAANPVLVAFKDTSMQVTVNAMSGLLTEAAASASVNSADSLKTLAAKVSASLTGANTTQAASLINAQVTATNTQIGKQTVTSVDASAIAISQSKANAVVSQQLAAASAAASGKTLAVVDLTGRGTQPAPASVDGAANSGVNTFTVTAGAKSTFVEIAGCTSGDTISITGVGSSVLVASNSGANMVLTSINASGVVTRLTLVGVTSATSVIGTLSDFNALGLCVTSYQ
jgi:hypothetical protein